MEKLERIAFVILRVVGGGIFLLLPLCALAETRYILPGGAERYVRVWDFSPGNLVAAVLAEIVLYGGSSLERKLSDRGRRLVKGGTLAIVLLWTAVFSLWWIFSAERRPVGDQAFVYGGASYFQQGDFRFLQEGGYCHIYPYQLGLMALIELIYQFVEPLQYRPLQVILALMAVGIVYLGFRIVGKFTDSMAASVLYSLWMAGCLPLFFYTSWVYGDIPGIFFGFLGFLLLLQYESTHKLRYLAGMAVSFCLAVLVRQASVILLAALALAAEVSLLRRRDAKLLTAVIVACLLPVLTNLGIRGMYEIRSGIPRSEGVPPTVTLAMGMQESSSGSGWDNNYQKDVYYDSNYDTEEMDRRGRKEIQERLEYFRENPLYAFRFYAGKMLSQWNQPLYQSLFFTANYAESGAPASGSVAEHMSEDYFPAILRHCNRLQFVVYLGMFFYFCFSVRREKGMLRQLLAIACVGGFLFSLLWEAKARYILPWYLFLFPCAVEGYWRLLQRLTAGRASLMKL